VAPAATFSAPRAWLGGYLLHAPGSAPDVSLTHYGVEGDFHLVQQPLASRVSPFVSLGVGAVRVEQPARMVMLPAMPILADEAAGPGLRLRTPFPAPDDEVTTSLSLAPGVGAQVHLAPGLALRGDVRGVIDFRERTTRTLELTGGISLAL
jgi:opacity protein-like surface antigen